MLRLREGESMTEPHRGWAPANDFHSKDPLGTNEEHNRRVMSEIGREMLLRAINRYIDRHGRAT
jgi:hypothetical protein